MLKFRLLFYFIFLSQIYYTTSIRHRNISEGSFESQNKSASKTNKKHKSLPLPVPNFGVRLENYYLGLIYRSIIIQSQQSSGSVLVKCYRVVHLTFLFNNLHRTASHLIFRRRTFAWISKFWLKGWWQLQKVDVRVKNHFILSSKRKKKSTGVKCFI